MVHAVTSARLLSKRSILHAVLHPTTPYSQQRGDFWARADWVQSPRPGSRPRKETTRPLANIAPVGGTWISVLLKLSLLGRHVRALKKSVKEMDRVQKLADMT